MLALHGKMDPRAFTSGGAHYLACHAVRGHRNQSKLLAIPGQTSRRGIFAIGDVPGSIKRVAAAVGEGAQIVATLHATWLRWTENHDRLEIVHTEPEMWKSITLPPTSTCSGN